GIKSEFHQIDVSLSTDNKLVFTTKSANRNASLTITAGSTTVSGSALSTMGFAGYQDAVKSTVDLSAGITIGSSGSGNFSIHLGTKDAIISLGSGVTYSKATL